MIRIEGAAHSAPNLPSVNLLNGNSVTLDMAEPCWLYTGRITELDDQGTSWRFVYRTTLELPRTTHQQLRDLLDGARVIDSKIVVDPHMMFGTGELSLWELETYESAR
ncbi:hypothetical protein A5675_17340 [Mycobacterium malmoense]|uniref:hypothetical protein n=1 Tax=Mycobacterium malmoense TaxID=1780 RepID=UPI00080BBFCC|nr:hypothetical protein [Mycobacterium malmoense]OCB36991.1 hypothetical protein A5675_17340 [Mycobacterium malmoense]